MKELDGISRILSMIFCLLCVFSFPTLAEDTVTVNKTATEVKPVETTDAVDSINPDILNVGAKLSLIQAVEFLKNQATNDYDGWIVPPKHNRKVIGTTNGVVNGRIETRKIKIPIYKREQFSTKKYVKEGASVDAVPVLKTVIAARNILIGTKDGTENVFIRDPKGTVTQTYTMPIYDKGGPDYWDSRLLGHNALAIFAMRKAGVSANDETIRKMVDNIRVLLMYYGFPDTTWDLAWLTAAFSTFPDDSDRGLAEKMALKLLDGQITSGPARGMWGPVCINRALLAKAITYLNDLNKQRTEAPKPTNVKNRATASQAKADEALQKLQMFKADMNRISSLWKAFARIHWPILLESDTGDKIGVAGVPEYIYNQTSVDIESTALVLYALRQAADNGVLPKSTWRPVIDAKHNKTLLPPEDTSAILARAANAIAVAQKDNGWWDQMNIHEPVNDFDKVSGIAGVPIDAKSFPELKSDVTLGSCLQGYSSLINIGDMVGLSKVLGRFEQNIASAVKHCREKADAVADIAEKGDNKKYGIHYEDYLYLIGLNRNWKVPIEDNRTLWSRLARRLLNEQAADGSWGGIELPHREFWSTSVGARIAALKPVKNEESGFSYAYVPYSCHRILDVINKRKTSFWERPKGEKVFSTAFAMLFLVDGIRPPIAGECAISSSAGPSLLLPRVVEKLQKDSHISLAYLDFGGNLSEAQLASLPALFFRGSGSFTIKPEMKKSMVDYLNHGGFVVVETTADETGTNFLTGSCEFLQDFEKGCVVTNIGNDADLVGKHAATIKLQAVRRSNGSISAVLVPIGVAQKIPSEVLTQEQAVDIVSLLLSRRQKDLILQEEYPIAFDREQEDIKALKTQMLDALNGSPMIPANTLPEEKSSTNQTEQVEQVPPEEQKKPQAEDEKF